MGRAKKIVTPGPAPAATPPPSNTAQLQLQLQLAQVQQEIASIHQTGDPERVQTNLRLAGLQVRAWDLESLLAPDVNVRLACARQSASWAEQVVRAAKALQVDLLRELFTKAEQMERHSSAMKDLK